MCSGRVYDQEELMVGDLIIDARLPAALDETRASKRLVAG